MGGSREAHVRTMAQSAPDQPASDELMDALRHCVAERGDSMLNNHWRFRCVTGALLATLTFVCSYAHAQAGRHFPSEKQALIDRVTGRPLTVLTAGAFNDSKIYPTHPQWAADGVHILFRSTGRTPDGLA